MLLAAIGLVFYYQRQQVRSHRTLMAEYSLRRVMSESAVVGLRVTDLKGRMLYVRETTNAAFSSWTSPLQRQDPDTQEEKKQEMLSRIMGK